MILVLAAVKVPAQTAKPRICLERCDNPKQSLTYRYAVSIPGCENLLIEAVFDVQECPGEVNIWSQGFRVVSVSGVDLNTPECLDAYRNFLQPGGGPVNVSNYNYLLDLLADAVSITHFQRSYNVRLDYQKYLCPNGMITHNLIRSLCRRGIARYVPRGSDGSVTLAEAREIECSQDCCIQKRTICYQASGLDGVGPNLSVTDEAPVPTADPSGCANINSETPPGWTELYPCSSSCRKVIRRQREWKPAD